METLIWLVSIFGVFILSSIFWSGWILSRLVTEQKDFKDDLKVSVTKINDHSKECDINRAQLEVTQQSQVDQLKNHSKRIGKLEVDVG